MQGTSKLLGEIWLITAVTISHVKLNITTCRKIFWNTYIFKTFIKKTNKSVNSWEIYELPMNETYFCSKIETLFGILDIEHYPLTVESTFALLCQAYWLNFRNPVDWTNVFLLKLSLAIWKNPLLTDTSPHFLI